MAIANLIHIPQRHPQKTAILTHNRNTRHTPIPCLAEPNFPIVKYTLSNTGPAVFQILRKGLEKVHNRILLFLCPLSTNLYLQKFAQDRIEA